LAEESSLRSDQLVVLEEVAARLESAGLAYMVSGSTAMNYYAVPRMTRDIDIVIELDLPDIERFVALFVDDFYCDQRVIREAVRTRGTFNLIHLALVIKVDFIVRKASPYREEEFRRRCEATIDGAKIFLVSPEDLLLSKLHWAKVSHSDIQLRDAHNLAISIPDLDWSYIGRWASDLSVAHLLDEIRAEEA
jgi:hypothetical protein